MTAASLTRIRRYPVKAMAGEDLAVAQIEPWGIQGDRRWMLVDDDGRFLTAREHPHLLAVTPPRFDVGDELVEVDVWRSTVRATVARAPANEWASHVAGVSARLVYLDDPTRREVDRDYGKPTDRVSFADGFPLLLTSESSLAALDDWIAAGPHSGEDPLSMERFRPNVVVQGFGAWAEDEWRRVRIGAVWFRVARSCGRCVVTTTEPTTGVRGREPLASLAKHRNRDGRLLFGVNLIPDEPGAISVGDDVEVER